MQLSRSVKTPSFRGQRRIYFTFDCWRFFCQFSPSFSVLQKHLICRLCLWTGGRTWPHSADMFTRNWYFLRHPLICFHVSGWWMLIRLPAPVPCVQCTLYILVYTPCVRCPEGFVCNPVYYDSLKTEWIRGGCRLRLCNITQRNPQIRSLVDRPNFISMHFETISRHFSA